MAKGKRKRQWILLFRYENGQAVHLYEKLQKHDLNSRLKQGWKVVK